MKKDTYTKKEVRELIVKAMTISAHKENALLSFVIDCFLESNHLKEVQNGKASNNS